MVEQKNYMPKENERILCTKLPNGEFVHIKTEIAPEIRGDRPYEMLASLLASDKVFEKDLLSLVSNHLSIIIPSANPGGRVEIDYKIRKDLRPDLVYNLDDKSKIGLVELKSPRIYGRMGIRSAYEQVYRYINALGTINEAYIIAGRRGEQELSLPNSEISMFKINLISWDEVVDRLAADDSNSKESQYTILLIQIVDASRLLLKALANNPDLLLGVDDRNFEETVATLLFDLGFQNVELTPLRKDGGRDVIVRRKNLDTRCWETYLFECKHWVSGKKVTLSIVTRLANVTNVDKADGAVLLSTSGFGPRLLEQKAEFERQKILLRDQNHLKSWITLWERKFGAVLFTPIDPMEIIGF